MPCFSFLKPAASPPPDPLTFAKLAAAGSLSLPALAAGLSHNLSDLPLCCAGVSALFSLAKSPAPLTAGSPTLISWLQFGVPAICAAARAHPKSHELLSTGLSALGVLAGKSVALGAAAVASGALEVACAALELCEAGSEDNRSSVCQVAATCALANLLHAPADDARRADALNHICALIRLQTGTANSSQGQDATLLVGEKEGEEKRSDPLLALALHALRNAAAPRAAKAAAASAGALRLVPAALRAYLGDAAVQRAGLGALWSLAAPPSHKSLLIAAGSLELVLSSLRSHAGDAAVQELGIAALASLVWSNELARARARREGAAEAAASARVLAGSLGSEAGAALRRRCGELEEKLAATSEELLGVESFMPNM